ncbi:MAG: hypothetical protein ACRDDX_12375 [Cellulosilyticaceae bacterium]
MTRHVRKKDKIDEAMQGAFPYVAQWLETIGFINVAFKMKDTSSEDSMEKANEETCKVMDYLFDPDDDTEIIGEIAQSLLEEEMANMYNQWFAMFHQRMDMLKAFIDGDDIAIDDETPRVMEESFHDGYYEKHRIGAVGMYQYDHYKLCLDELREQQGDQATFQLTSALVGEEDGKSMTEEEKKVIEYALAPYYKLLHEEAEGGLLELKEAVEKMCVIGLKCSCVDAIQKVL